MDMMSGFSLYFNCVTLACGIYVLYTSLKLWKRKELFSNQLLVPKDSKPGDCLDEAGYVAFLKPRLLILGSVLTVTGGVCLADSILHIGAVLFPGSENISFHLVEGGIALCLVVLVWYMFCWTGARKRYWK